MVIGYDIVKVPPRLRCLGSAALNMATIASGSADVYYEWGIHCWDMAAGKLLIEEAGGIVANTKGRSAIIFVCLQCSFQNLLYFGFITSLS